MGRSSEAASRRPPRDLHTLTPDSRLPRASPRLPATRYHVPETNTMVTAIVLLNIRRAAINETAQQLLDIHGVTEVYSLAGEWDLAAIVRARSNDHLAAVVTEHLLKLDTVERSQTLIAFRAYSKLDLETMFDLGLT